MSLNLGTILSASAEQAPDNIALRIEDVSISYGQLHRAAAGIAAGLREASHLLLDHAVHPTPATDAMWTLPSAG